ncbi:hypothetical protein [Nocardioides sp. GY 10127]|uniref:hypothetical protein n=1 Tax=Nocardioides sp. GY 10127 TaxID=2569762 RepID=UPI0010A8583F|nr:hypothetical protein [Nocardioides sp. GY 10127]TIC81669.1 hypothetical protein E8D37_10735 [Nocardioides sp. GY 10127]
MAWTTQAAHTDAAPPPPDTPDGVLAATEACVRARRAAEVSDLELALAWADLHAGDPALDPGRSTWDRGGDRLVELGGEGCPMVRELSLPELAVARRTHVLSTRAFLADALDLRHRLPACWAVVRRGECEPWVARKVASMSRGLSRRAVEVVDLRVAQALAGEGPSRVLTVAEAAVIAADPAAHAARVEAQLRRRGVWLTRTDEHGFRSVIARVEAGDAVWVDALVERVADALAARPDLLPPDLPRTVAREELRAIAFGWLAHPERVAALLAEEAVSEEEAPVDDAVRTPSHRNRVVLYVHLSDTVLTGSTRCPARAEGLGPLLLEQLRRLVGHARVTVRPVLDLGEWQNVNAYEHPMSVRERVHLRSPGCVFPHSTTMGRGPTGGLDLDHPVPWDPGGPPGQTGDLQAAPLSRTSHRAKTHAGFRCVQLSEDEYAWRTPHGLCRLVTPDGTTDLSEWQFDALAAGACA